MQINSHFKFSVLDKMGCLMFKIFYLYEIAIAKNLKKLSKKNFISISNKASNVAKVMSRQKNRSLSFSDPYKMRPRNSSKNDSLKR